MDIRTDITQIIKIINKEYNKNFHYTTIYHQIQKMKDAEFGKKSEDKVEKNDKMKLVSFCFMSKRMIKFSRKFSDVIIIDATHKTNRFNMPLLDIAVVNNFGRTITVFFALFSDHKYESYLRALQQFKNQLKRIPGVILTDDEDALTNGRLFIYFSDCSSISKQPAQYLRLACTTKSKEEIFVPEQKSKKQHRQRQYGKKELYQLIINLPFQNYVSDFEKILKKIISNKYVNENSKKYIQEKCSKKEAWVKAFVNEIFGCGTCTTSQIESKHSVLKKYVTSVKRIIDV